MFKLLLTVLAAAALAVGGGGCSSDATKNSSEARAPAGTDSTAQAAAQHGSAPLYQRPMPPDALNAEPAEPAEPAAGAGRTFEVQFTATPTAIEAGKAVKLAFRPQDKATPDAPLPLAVVHEKKLHLIIVSQDLSEFFHEYPAFDADGTYHQAFTFKAGGDYVLFQDYTPDGDRPQRGRQTLGVNGPKRPVVKFEQDVLTWKSPDGYFVKLNLMQVPVAGTPLQMNAKLGANGQPITDLAPYLGALGQLVIVSEDTKQCVFLYPLGQADKGPNVGFQTQFAQAGRYRVFFEFKHGGQVRTADFVLNVAPATAAN